MLAGGYVVGSALVVPMRMLGTFLGAYLLGGYGFLTPKMNHDILL